MTKSQELTQQKEKIIKHLMTSDVFLERALLAMFERQTENEQEMADASTENQRGFSKAHAELMTSYAQFVLMRMEKGVPEGKCLTEKQREYARKALRRYSRQLVEIKRERQIAKENEQAKLFPSDH